MSLTVTTGSVLHFDGGEFHVITISSSSQESAFCGFIIPFLQMKMSRVHEQSVCLISQAVQTFEQHQRVAKICRVGRILYVCKARIVIVGI